MSRNTSNSAASRYVQRPLALMLGIGLIASSLLWNTPAAESAVNIQYVDTLGGSGRAETYPSGLEVTPDGFIVAADTGGDRVVKYAEDGTQQWVYGSFGTEVGVAGGLNNPRDVGVDSDGNVYIADTANSRIVKLNSSGVYQTEWRGPGGDQIGSPMGITVTNDVVYVADAVKKKVRIFDTSGNQTLAFGEEGDCTFSAVRDVDAAANGDLYIANYLNHDVLHMTSTGTCIDKWGTQGEAAGEFKSPYGVRIATDPTWGESVYIADSNNDRVQVFDPVSYTYLGEFGSTGAYNVPGTHTELRRVAVATDGSGDVWTSDLWGWRIQKFTRETVGWAYSKTVGGTAPGLSDSAVFNEVRQIGFDVDGNFWAADTVHHRFIHMSSTGTVLSECGTRGWDPGEFNWPESAAVDHTTGELWFTDTKQSRLQVLDSDCTNPTFIGEYGTALGEFNWPGSVVIDQANRILYVSDRRNDRIMSYNLATSTWIEAYGVMDGGLLHDPRQIALDPTTGNILVADMKNNRIVELSADTDGSSISLVGTFTAGTLDRPEGVAVDGNGSVYIADTGNSRVVVLNSNDTVDTTFTQPTGLYSPTAVSIGPDGRLYVSDTHNDRIQVYTVGAVPPTSPANTVLPVVTGTADVGQQLSTTNGTWTGTTPITYSYQWQRCTPGCANIGSQTSSDYTVTTNDIGAKLRVVVTATNTAGNDSANSAQTATVPNPPEPPANTALPVVSGTAEIGEVIGTTGGSWSGTAPITVTYQWQRCDGGCTNIVGATGSNHAVTGADAGFSLRSVVTGTNVAGSDSANSNQVGPVPNLPEAPANTAPPVVSGTAEVGMMLTTTGGSWSGTTPITLSYQWQRCDGTCSDVDTATGSTYIVGSSDIGMELHSVVTATNEAGNDSANSNRTATVPTPAVNTFIDDDGNIHEPAIEAIAAAGITKGCNPPTNNRYCPDDPVTRGEMAAFLNRALGLDSTSRDFFIDDNSSVFEADINRLAASGITKGCNPPINDRYCVNDPVTRGQMAAFLNRALDLDQTSIDFFSDDSESIFEADINRLAAAGITKGCNPPANDQYCPDQLVTRAEMATFLARALDLDV